MNQEINLLSRYGLSIISFCETESWSFSCMKLVQTKPEKIIVRTVLIPEGNGQYSKQVQSGINIPIWVIMLLDLSGMFIFELSTG